MLVWGIRFQGNDRKYSSGLEVGNYNHELIEFSSQICYRIGSRTKKTLHPLYSHAAEDHLYVQKI